MDPVDSRSGVETISGNKWFTGYFFSNLASGIISPLIPLYVLLYLHMSVFYVGVASAVISAASVPFLIFWGNLSDKFGRRKIFIVFGFLGGGTSLFGIVMATNIWTFVGILALFQVAVMASVPVSTMIIIENSSKESWPTVMSRFNMVAAAGNVTGLAAGALSIIWISAHTAFLIDLYLVAAVIYIIAGVLVQIMIPEPARNLPRHRLSGIYSIRLTEKLRYFPSTMIHIISPGTRKERSLPVGVWSFLISASVLMFAFQIFFVPFPAYMIDIQKSSDFIIYMMYLGNAIFGAFTYGLSGAAVNEFGPRKILIASVLVRAVIFGITSIIAFEYILGNTTVLALIIMYSVLGGIWSLISISQLSILSNGVNAKVKGKALGYYNSLTGVGQIVAAVAAGYLSITVGYGATFGFSVISVIAAAAFVMWSISLITGKRKVPGNVATA